MDIQIEINMMKYIYMDRTYIIRGSSCIMLVLYLYICTLYYNNNSHCTNEQTLSGIVDSKHIYALCDNRNILYDFIRNGIGSYTT